MKYSALVVAAGSGSRMKLGYNKVYMRLSDGKCLLDKTLSVFMDDPDCTQIVVVTDPAMFRQEIGEKTVGKVVVARGGETRQESVHNGLMAVLEETVFVHDGARPFLKKEVLERLKGTMETEDAALLMVPCKDTIKRVIGGYVEETAVARMLKAGIPEQSEFFIEEFLIHPMVDVSFNLRRGLNDKGVLFA